MTQRPGAKSWRKIVIVSSTAILLAGCAHGPKNDPYETFNRHTYRMNDKIDKAVLKPVAKVYNVVVPPPAKKGVTNFFNNISEIPSTANDILQLNFYQAASDAWRFIINSTVGVFGIFDVASHMGLRPHYTDLGVTFARYGYTNSSYLMLPFFGPSTIRDAIGRPIDYNYLTPYPFIKPDVARRSLLALRLINRRAALLSSEGILQEAALDPYSFIRNAYMQKRRAQIAMARHDGKENVEAVNAGEPMGEADTGDVDDLSQPFDDSKQAGETVGEHEGPKEANNSDAAKSTKDTNKPAP